MTNPKPKRGGKKAPRRCRWCRELLIGNRPSGICLSCIQRRDLEDAQLDKDFTKYVSPDKRPGHRFYLDPAKAEARKASTAKARAARQAKLSVKPA